MDQTPMLFVLPDGRMYNSKGAEVVWCNSAASTNDRVGLGKRQYTAQLTVFGNGILKVRMTLIV